MEQPVKDITPEILVFSGGGSLGYAHIGVLSYLEKSNRLKKVHTYAGNSIGAIMAFFCTMGVKSKALWDIFNQFNMEDVLSGEFNIDMLTNLWGIEDGELIEAFMVDVMSEYGFDPFITMKDLQKKTSLNLIVVATRSDTMEANYFSATTTPNVLVLDAVRASISIPFLFTPKKIGEHLYFDGFLSDNFPLNYTKSLFPQQCILGSVIKSFQPRLPHNLMDAFINIVGKLMIGPSHDIHEPNVHVVWTQLKQLTGLDWVLSPEDKKYAHDEGHHSAMNYLQGKEKKE